MENRKNIFAGCRGSMLVLAVLLCIAVFAGCRKNTADNITPMDARDHFDSRGIHEPGGTCDKLTTALKEA